MGLRIPILSDYLDKLYMTDEVFPRTVQDLRICSIRGPVGSGKTILAVYLAAMLLRMKVASRVIANVAVRGRSDPNEVVPPGQYYYSEYLKREYYAGEQLPVEDSVIILDEGALFMHSASEAQMYMQFIRKCNNYLLIPSAMRPSGLAREFEVWRDANFYKAGLPYWVYKWTWIKGKRASDVVYGQFNLYGPHRLFGLLESLAIPTDDGDILEALENTYEYWKIAQHRRKRIERRITKEFGQAALLSPIVGTSGVSAGNVLPFPSVSPFEENSAEDAAIEFESAADRIGSSLDALARKVERR